MPDYVYDYRSVQDVNTGDIYLHGDDEIKYEIWGVSKNHHREVRLYLIRVANNPERFARWYPFPVNYRVRILTPKK